MFAAVLAVKGHKPTYVQLSEGKSRDVMAAALRKAVGTKTTSTFLRWTRKAACTECNKSIDKMLKEL